MDLCIFLKKVFACLSGEKSTGPSEFNLFYISLLKSLNLGQGVFISTNIVVSVFLKFSVPDLTWLYF